MTNGRITEDEVLLGETSKKVYREIISYLKREGIPPTQKEIANSLKITKSNVGYHLKRLSLANLLKYTPGKIRGIKINDI